MAGQIFHEWQGTTLVITSDSGTSSCDLKGSKGDIGARGSQGSPGITNIDTTLSIAGYGADAKTVGERLAALGGGGNSPIKLEYMGDGSGSGNWYCYNGNHYYCLTSVGTIESGATYLLVDTTRGVFGTVSYTFDTDGSSYCNDIHRKTLDMILDSNLNNQIKGFTFEGVYYGYYYIAVESPWEGAEYLGELLANLKVYKIVVEDNE